MRRPRKPVQRKPLSKALARNRNLTLRMLEELWDFGLHSSAPGIPDAKDAITLGSIRERLIERHGPWTPADYMNVGQIYKKYIQQK